MNKIEEIVYDCINIFEVIRKNRDVFSDNWRGRSDRPPVYDDVSDGKRRLSSKNSNLKKFQEKSGTLKNIKVSRKVLKNPKISRKFKNQKECKKKFSCTFEMFQEK